MFQVAHRIQGILKRTSNVVFYIRSTCTGISGHHHDRICINIRIQVDRQFGQREKTKNHHCQKAEGGHNRFLNRTFV